MTTSTAWPAGPWCCTRPSTRYGDTEKGACGVCGGFSSFFSTQQPPHLPLPPHPAHTPKPTHQSGGAHHHKARAPRASVDSLPSDTLKQIFRFLPAPALCAAEMVCPLWRSIAAQDDAWWASLCEAQFGVSPDAFTPPPDPTKMLYVLQHSSLLSIKRGGSGGSGGRLDNWARFF